MTYELYHHGILGMRWGVRRYQNKDGTLTALGRQRLQTGLNQYQTSKHSDDIKISKTKKLYRIGGVNESSTSGPKHTYVVASDADYYKYASIAGEGIQGRTKYTFNSVQDLKIAGYKTQADALVELYGKNKVSDIQSGMFKNTGYPWSKEEIKEESKIILNAFEDEKGFNSALRQIGQNLMSDSDTAEKFKSYLKSKGYDGLVDMNDDDFADLPLYLFDRSKLVEKGRQEVSMLDREYMERNFGDDW